MDVNWLEAVLSRHESGKRIKRVSTVESQPLVAPGENYSSIMTSLTLNVVLENGKESRRSIIVKSLPKSEMQVKLINETFYFKNEIQMYTDVFPIMDILKMEHGDTSETLWCECISHTPYSQLVLEDLREKGYRTVDRKRGLGLEEGRVVLAALGRLHALGHVLLSRGFLTPEVLNPFIMSTDRPILNDFFTGALHTMAKQIRSHWDRSWSDTADKLEKMNDVGSKLAELCREETSYFKSFIHGDCWTNNILFKYCPYTEKPISVRFIDFQSAAHTSVSWDLAYFLTSSLAVGVRKAHLKELLTAYLDSLRRTLTFYGLEGTPGLEEITTELARIRFFSLLITCTLVPLRCANEPMDFEKLLDTTQDNSTAFNQDMFSDMNTRKVIQDDFEEYREAGLC